MVANKLIQGLNRAIQLAGQPIRIRYYTVVFDDVYDESIRYLQSGNNIWTSGISFPVGGFKGATEGLLLEQGKLISSDKKMYIRGNTSLTGSNLTIDIQIGSPTGDLYSTILDGGTNWSADNTVYTRQYIRRLTTDLING